MREVRHQEVNYEEINRDFGIVGTGSDEQRCAGWQRYRLGWLNNNVIIEGAQQLPRSFNNLRFATISSAAIQVGLGFRCYISCAAVNVS